MIAIPSYTRLIACGVGLAAVLGGLWYFGHARFKAGQEDVRTEIRSALEHQGRTNKRATGEALKSLRAENVRLRAAGPGRSIRVCDGKTGVPVPGTARGTDGPGPTGGQLQESPGRDIGPQLYAEADRADALAAQLRALQDWLRRIQREQ